MLRKRNLENYQNNVTFRFLTNTSNYIFFQHGFTLKLYQSFLFDASTNAPFVSRRIPNRKEGKKLKRNTWMQMGMINNRLCVKVAICEGAFRLSAVIYYSFRRWIPKTNQWAANTFLPFGWRRCLSMVMNRMKKQEITSRIDGEAPIFILFNNQKRKSRFDWIVTKNVDLLPVYW